MQPTGMSDVGLHVPVPLHRPSRRSLIASFLAPRASRAWSYRTKSDALYVRPGSCLIPNRIRIYVHIRILREYPMRGSGEFP